MWRSLSSAARARQQTAVLALQRDLRNPWATGHMTDAYHGFHCLWLHGPHAFALFILAEIQPYSQYGRHKLCGTTACKPEHSTGWLQSDNTTPHGNRRKFQRRHSLRDTIANDCTGYCSGCVHASVTSVWYMCSRTSKSF